MLNLDEVKNYLRVDYEADDELIKQLLETATRLCCEVSRCEEDEFQKSEISKTAVLYALGYLYEHREEANHHELNLTLRSLLFSLREGKL